MRRFAQFVSYCTLILVLFTSCASTARREAPPYYDFQGMAQPGVIVVTVDALKEPELVKSAFEGLDEFARRAQRVSLSLTPTSDDYPLASDALQVYGVVEGDYPRWLMNTGMMYARELSRTTTTDGLEYFTQKSGDFSLYAPRNNRLLFTNGAYEEAYGSFISRGQTIDLNTAIDMTQASIAVYVAEPTTFFDLGLDLPESVIKQAKVMLLLIHQKPEGGYSLDAFITMETPRLATTLSQMVRTGYLARLKRDKIPYKISDLMKMFLLEEDRVTIKHMDLGDEQMQLLRDSLGGML